MGKPTLLLPFLLDEARPHRKITAQGNPIANGPRVAAQARCPADPGCSRTTV